MVRMATQLNGEPDVSFVDQEELKSYVQARGMVVLPMRPIKQVFKVGRLAPGPRAEIKRMLGRLMIGHMPVEIPDDQAQYVRLYDLSTPIGRVIDRVANPAQGDERELMDQLKGDPGAQEREAVHLDALEQIKSIATRALG